MGIKLFRNMKIPNLMGTSVESPSESLTPDPPLKFPAALLRSPDANHVGDKIVTFDDDVIFFSKRKKYRLRGRSSETAKAHRG
eukprot:TRINITY_DN472_c0_g1_i2.p2 TRINITY_DN472_c0_g1~~TRINITY_DN472_c0_g1_i2.p2  ORF type:complete len:83 (+),score=32.88 TRINITY_DN472_c0_g1_i2:1208-1456(+)